MVKMQKLPSCIQLVITYKCQCNCLMCQQANSKIRKQESQDELGYANFVNIIDSILKNYNPNNKPSFVIDGGEPLIKPFTIKILEYLNNKGISTVLNTNLGIANKAVLDRLSKLNNTKIWVSIDGYKDVHDTVRKLNGLYDTTKKNIIYLHKKGKPVTIRYTLSRLNYTSLEKTFCDLEEHISSFYLQPLIWHNKKILEMNKRLVEKLNLTDDFYPAPNLTLENKSQVEFVYRTTRKLMKKSTKFASGKSREYLQRHYLTTAAQNNRICSLFDDTIRIQPNGNTYFCFSEGPNMLHNSLTEILNFKNRKLISNYMNKGIVFPKCFKCCLFVPRKTLFNKIITKSKNILPKDIKRLIKLSYN